MSGSSDAAPRRSARLGEQQEAQREPGKKSRQVRDPVWDNVPVGPGEWATGAAAGGTRVQARYTDAEAEETTEFQCRSKKGEWRTKRPTEDKGYQRYQFEVGGVREETRRNRVFCHLVHGPPPAGGEPHEWHADHTSKVTVDGVERWARSTGPVQWLDRVAHGLKHGKEGADEARRRSQAAEAESARKR